MRRLIQLAISRPRRSLAIGLFVVAGVSLGVLRLEFDFSPQQVYGGQKDVIETAEAHKRLFRYEDSIVLVLLESVDGRSLIRPDVLEWMLRLSQRVPEIDGVTDVASLVALEAPRLNLRLRQMEWVPLVPQVRFRDDEWLGRRLHRLPLLNDMLVSADRQLTLTLVTLSPDGRDIRTTSRRIADLRHLLDDMPSLPGTRVMLSGVPAIRVDVVRSLQNDQLVMTPVSAFLFVLISVIMYRSVRITLVALMAVLAAVALTLGIMGWCGMTFSILSNIVPTLVMIIGAANCVHIIGRLQIVLRTGQADGEAAVRQVMDEMSKTCFLTLATTAIGFGSLLMARSELLQLLAVQSAVGMLCNYLCLMLLLGPGLKLTAHTLPRQSRLSAVSAAVSGGGGGTDSGPWRSLGAFVCRHAPLIVGGHVVVAAAAVAAATQIPLNSYMFETYESGHPVVAVTETLDDRMSGLVTLELQLAADRAERFFDPDVILACGRIRRRLEQDGRITFVRDYVQVLSAFSRALLSEDREVVRAGAERVQRMMKRLDRDDLHAAFLAEDQARARIMLRVRDIGSRGFKGLVSDVRRILDRELPADIRYSVTGDAWLHAVCMDQFVHDLFYSLLAASGIIFVLIGLLFRSVRTGLVSALPNLFPLTITLGYMYLRGYELTAGNVIVFAISLGIAVDDTIHFLARYREEAGRCEDPADIVSAALASSGRAIVLTSLLIVSGLSVLMFSEFLPTRRFAELAAVTMCAALPGDVVLLPAMLSLLKKMTT